MKFRILSVITVFSLLLSACGALGNVIPGASVTVSIVYGSEKQDWLEPLIQQFNEARNQTSE
jgi:ABC-type glycerol-3-phosphate transport system substrate-binding protein